MTRISLPIVDGDPRPPRPEEPRGDARRSGPARPSRAPDEVNGPKPPWLKVRLSNSPTYADLKRLVKEQGLHTVCESASCPNIGECWSRKALTFMILGNVCTRSCGFCDVLTGKPGRVDEDEPRRVAASLAALGLRYAVVTSVDRDDLPDGGAAIWAETIRQIKAACPEMGLEVLTPDFKGVTADLATVVQAGPDVFAHNLETIARLHPTVRPQARYERSLQVIQTAAEMGAVTKSGLMLGLGESEEEALEAMRDLRAHGCEILNLGQYLRPSKRHLPLARWVEPEEFARLKAEGERMGFRHVESGALVRSSYRADMQAEAMGLEHSWKISP
jgi:lipoic acid synthetase